MYRAVATCLAPASDGAVATLVVAASETGADSAFTDYVKLAPGVASRIFVGSFWIGLFFCKEKLDV